MRERELYNRKLFISPGSGLIEKCMAVVAMLITDHPFPFCIYHRFLKVLNI